jgi:3-oxoacyl-[acyl-carrier-protein] synthase III
MDSRAPHARITSIGTYVPSRILSNKDLERLVDTNDEWITTRTGIRERHIAAPDQATSDLAVEAARLTLARRGINASELDAIIVCTVTPDMLFPATACLVQEKLGASKAWGFDLSAACSGFVYGLTVGNGLIAAGAKKVLVIGADTMSRIIDYTDRSTCVLFGDGAGAFLLEPSDDNRGFVHALNLIDGSGAEALKMPAGGSRIPPSEETVAGRMHYVHQEGQQVFKFAVKRMADMCSEIVEKAGLKPEEVKLLIPHQANMRIVQAAAERLGMSPDRYVLNIGKYGNTTAATIPLATQDAIDDGRLQAGDIVLFAAVGAGYTTGANLWRWAF